MPELDLGGWPECSNDSAFIRVLATMLFPDDDSQRTAVSTLPNAVDPTHPATGLLRAAYLKDFHNGGVVAGDVLFVVRIIAERHPEIEPSISKSAIVLETDAKQSGRCSLDATKRFWADEKSIRNAFYKYRAVAHLWAAYLLMCREAGLASMPAIDALNPHAAEKIIENFSVLLAVSENMRCFGEEHVLSRRKGKETLLNPAATWRVPSRVPLPDISVTIPPLSSAAFEDLQSYRARVRK
jgi:hypothetical protein